MEESWKYITPTKKGITNTKIFYESVYSYAKSKDINLSCYTCDIPENKSHRPSLLKVLKFLKKAITQDNPVAFLNLCNGDEKDLDSWHWVTVIAIEYNKKHLDVFLHILDGGALKKIDLPLWLKTTKLGGGFSYFKVLKNIKFK
jgi:hypothetical protein